MSSIEPGSLFARPASQSPADPAVAESPAAHAARLLIKGTLDALDDAVLVLDSGAKTILSANRAVERVLGYAPYELTGESVIVLYKSPEHYEDWAQRMGESLDREGSFAVEVEMRRRSGQVFTARNTVTEISDEAGNRLALVSIIRDMAEARNERGELEPQESREQSRPIAEMVNEASPREAAEQPGMAETIAQLAAIVESSDDAIISMTPAGIVQSWNPAAQRLFGFTRAEAVGQPISIIYPPDQPDEFPEIMGRLNRGEHIDHYETIRQRKDGSRIDVSVSISPIKDETGRIVAASKISRDISERKRTEEADRFLVSASSILSSSLDYEATLKSLARLAIPFLADWCVVYVQGSEGIQRIAMEHAEGSEEDFPKAIGHAYPLNPNATIGVPKVLRTGESEFFPVADAALLAADAVDSEELARLTEPLDVRSWICVPLAMRAGPAFGAISFICTGPSRRYSRRDLALAEELGRRAALAVENARLYSEARNAIRLRDQFLSIASHELKTPLTALLGYTDLLLRKGIRSSEVSEARNQRALRTIHDSAVRLNKLIGALLDISRIQEGRFGIEHDAVDLKAIVDRLIADTRPTLTNHTIEYQAPDQPVIVEGDDLRLEQVVQNLLQNAIKYSYKGGHISVRLASANGQAVFSVQDPGIGIPRDALPKLFARFYRAENAEKLNIGGMGIGLFVVQEIVSLHGGTIDIESEEEKGSTFTVRLPLMDAPR